ncbi:YtxH domain-containing protein [Mycobacterium paraintracellulare]|uniref:YtxH domain-containing protein n=2 Tax=Mycobacterium TaxID=1763 RepID=UPI001916C4FA|nr:YtxH domain-containing protein [Mycobacterium paraintracellulare]WVL48998.1 YtxH domain-containing protein [Mycobacterium paraintracellulare]
MPSPETAAALIGGVAGLGTGVLGTFFAPWAKWRYDNRLKMREDQKTRIEEWREGIATLREAEKDRPVEYYDQMERMSRSLGDSVVRPVQPKLVPQNPDNAVATTKSWFITLEPYLRDHKRQQIESLQTQPLKQRKHSVSDLLAKEVARIEREVWRLV